MFINGDTRQLMAPKKNFPRACFLDTFYILKIKNNFINNFV